MKYHVDITPDALGGLYVGDVVRHIEEMSQVFPVKLWEYKRVGSGDPVVFDLDVEGQDGRHWKMRHTFTPTEIYLRFDAGSTEFTGPEANLFKECDDHAIFLVRTYPTLTKIRVQII